MPHNSCPLCLQLATVTGAPDRDVAYVMCETCGSFSYAPDYSRPEWQLARVPEFLIRKGLGRLEVTRAAGLLRSYLSIYTRECTESGRRPELLNLLDVAALERLAETYADTPIYQKPGKLLRLLEKRTAFPGQQVRLARALDYPAVHAINHDELGFYLDALQKDGSLRYENTLEADQTKLTTFVTITLAGWAKLGATGSASRTAFVAMSFDPSLDSVFLDGIAAAIRDAGYEPLRVDKVHHNEKICDRIVAEIRRSRFLIADVTDQRQGVYFEAGFAMALGLPVIWSCREGDKNNVHFDTRQYNHIFWKAPADLYAQLRDRIVATIGSIR